MTQHADILDTRESVRGAFAGAIALHLTLVAVVLFSTYFANTNDFGSQNAGGAAVGIEAVNSIPIPHHGMQNPLANDTPSEAPQAPVKQPVERRKAETPPPDAIPLKMKNLKKPAKVASERQRYRPYDELEKNQLTSTTAPQVSSPLFSAQPGSGKVGPGANTTLGFRCPGYAAQIQTLVAQHWKTGEVDPRVQTAPVVIATYDLLGDGSIRNVRLLQTSGISTLDYSVQRAIQDASPFPPIPSTCGRDSAKVEFTFELKR